jgi:hypothetical protein
MKLVHIEHASICVKSLVNRRKSPPVIVRRPSKTSDKSSTRCKSRLTER